mmetsp:Transcript_26807/g.29889  ORF Transcript_26807/g.29889 Transcript_26807/m.29889 type:complete len:162 (-) Transcript_26807:106-591(-)
MPASKSKPTTLFQTLPSVLIVAVAFTFVVFMFDATSFTGVAAERWFTEEEIAEFDGTDDTKPIYLSILGRVYDVSKGRQYYGPESGYHFFAGKDATRSFLTGCFNAECFAEQPKGVEGLSKDDIQGVYSWVKDYNQKYVFVGFLKGYYDPKLDPTPTAEEL